MNPKNDLVDVRFGMLVAKERVPRPETFKGQVHGTWWRCQCDCGGERIVPRQYLTQKNVRDCGCVARANKQRAGRARAEQLRGKNVRNFKTPGSDTEVHSWDGLCVECKCPQCGKTFDRLSSSWAYKISIQGVIRFFCTWRCLRMYKENHKRKPHGNSKAATAL